MTEARITLEPLTHSIRTVRQFVHQWLRTATGTEDDRAFLVMLLTSELVSNAILHAETELSVTISQVADRIRVEVQDGDPLLPQEGDPAADGRTGRGLVLLDRLALNWAASRTRTARSSGSSFEPRSWSSPRGSVNRPSDR